MSFWRSHQSHSESVRRFLTILFVTEPIGSRTKTDEKSFEIVKPVLCNNMFHHTRLPELTMAPHPYRVRANLLSYRAFLFFVSFWLFLYVCDNFVTFYLLVTASIGLSFEAHLAGK